MNGTAIWNKESENDRIFSGFQGSRDNECEATVAELTMSDETFTNGQVNREVLASLESSADERTQAIRIVNVWRASFVFPLRAVAKGMGHSALRINKFAIVSRRLKRMESITIKLRRRPMSHINLTTMQDVGGCRAVFWTISEVYKLVEKYTNAACDDYIKCPKSDGYRSVHIIVRYASKNPKHVVWNGKRIEIQIRTRLQHAWATAVETVDIFALQNIKIGKGQIGWRRFFALASSAFSYIEGTPFVADTPSDIGELTEELRALWKELNVADLMLGWATAMGHVPEVLDNTPEVSVSTASVFLVTVDLDVKHVYLKPYSNESVDLAAKEYAEVEQEIRQGRNAHTVLVAVDQINELTEAFPNLYGDTTVFLQEIRKLLNEPIAP
jgi:hypothetical protein